VVPIPLLDVELLRCSVAVAICDAEESIVSSKLVGRGRQYVVQTSEPPPSFGPDVL